MTDRKALLLLVVLIVTAGVGPALAQQSAEQAPATPPAAAAMDDARLGALITRLDPQAEGRPGHWRLTIRERTVFVITDERADRMRIISGIAKAEGIPPELLHRLMQANFDTALDARYALARNVLWSAYIHPLGALSDEQFVSGLAQVVNLSITFGTTFSSGSLTFGGGDSQDLLRELQDRLDAI